MDEKIPPEILKRQELALIGQAKMYITLAYGGPCISFDRVYASLIHGSSLHDNHAINCGSGSLVKIDRLYEMQGETYASTQMIQPKDIICAANGTFVVELPGANAQLTLVLFPCAFGAFPKNLETSGPLSPTRRSLGPPSESGTGPFSLLQRAWPPERPAPPPARSSLDLAFEQLTRNPVRATSIGTSHLANEIGFAKFVSSAENTENGWD